MVRGDALQVVELQAAPQLILLRVVAERRAHDVLRPAEARLLVVVVRQEQILRAGFREGRQAAVARVRDHLERLGRREMDDVHRHVGDFGERDRTMGRLRFGARRARQRVEFRRGLPFRERPLDQDVDGAAVLRVHQDQRAGVGRPLHGPEDRRVVQHEHAGVRHEQLERGDPLAHERVHLALHLIVQLGDDHMEAVVDHGLALRLLYPRFPGVVQRLTAVLNREVHDRRGSAERRRPRARLEVVGRRRTAERHVHVRVHVDAARQDVPPARVDHPVRVDLERRADDGDLFVLDQHVTLVLISGRDDRAVLDERLHGLDEIADFRMQIADSNPALNLKSAV